MPISADRVHQQLHNRWKSGHSRSRAAEQEVGSRLPSRVQFAWKEKEAGGWAAFAETRSAQSAASHTRARG